MEVKYNSSCTVLSCSTIYFLTPLETSDFAKLNILNQMKSLKTSDTDGLPTSLRLQIGARYMISTNVDVASPYQRLVQAQDQQLNNFRDNMELTHRGLQSS
jgi:hypothetical protein